MKFRHLTLAAGFLGAVITNHAIAVGLGEITLNSALNEPLDAEIELLNIGELTELEMLAGLGSQTDFDSAGVERLFLLTDLRFEVNISDKGNPVIQVSSKRPIREPYLDFLVELDWPAGRLLREYTLLLDMPLYATEKPVAKKIEAASSGAQPTATSTAGPSTPVPASATASPALAISDDEYQVASGDTVWAIASKIRPQGATMSQTMAAIKQANPDAFIGGNINLLKKGAVLRLPEGSDIQALSAADSATELATVESAAEATQAPVLDATPSTQSRDVDETSGEGRLKLAALGADEALSAASAGEDAEDGSEGTSVGAGADLDVAREELDRATRENAELRERIAMLEEQLSTNERLLEIQDDSMRASQVATLVEPDGIEPESDTAEQATASEATEEETPASAVAAKADTASSEEVAAEAEKSKPAKQDKGFNISAWMDYLLYPAIGLLALLLAVLMLFRNRKSDDETTDELSLQTLANKDEPLVAEEIDDETQLSDSDKEYIAELAEDLDEEGLQDLEDIEELDELRLEDGEGVDPKGEADIYMSLGNYTQAENILKGAIEQDPQDTALRLKLLEVHVNANDPDAFAEQYQQLLALNDPEAEAKAVALRAELIPETSFEEPENVSESPEVAELSAVQEEESDFVEPSLDFDLGDVSPDSIPEALEEPAQEAEPAVASGEESELEIPEEFDLGAETLGESREEILEEALEALEETADSDFGLDLDLEDVDLDSLSSEIDEEMLDVDLGEVEAEPEAPVVAAEESFVAPDVLEEQTLEELEDSILSGADDEENAQSLDDELKAFGDEDECDTKLVLAETYMDMGDPENARDLLNEVIAEGTDEQIQKARNLLETVT